MVTRKFNRVINQTYLPEYFEHVRSTVTIYDLYGPRQLIRIGDKVTFDGRKLKTKPGEHTFSCIYQQYTDSMNMPLP